MVGETRLSTFICGRVKQASSAAILNMTTSASTKLHLLPKGFRRSTDRFDSLPGVSRTVFFQGRAACIGCVCSWLMFLFSIGRESRD
jgi:hypothetical protein